MAQSIQEFASIGREQPHVGVDRHRGLEQDGLLTRPKYQVLCRGFLIACFVEGGGTHARLCGQFWHTEIELQYRLQPRECLAKHWEWIQVEPGRKGEDDPYQRPIFIEEVRLVAM